MPIEIRMPALSPTMTEGNLARWLKREGDEVHAGDVLAEIETDKATMEFEAVDDGRLGKILVPEGAEGIKVNQPIAVLLQEGEDASSLSLPTAVTAPAPHPLAVPAGRESEGAGPPVAAPRGRGESHGEGPRPTPPGAGQTRIFASPLARRMAAHAGLDLAGIRGSGPHGRIVKADIEAALAGAAAAPAVSAPAAPPLTAPAARPALTKERVAALAGNPPYSEKPLTGMRRTIARRLAEAKQTVPHFYMTVDCTIDRLLAIRQELNARSDGQHVSVNDFVVRAAALALRQVPEANASWSDEAILLWDSVDIAVAVALDDGLITPIIKQAHAKGLGTIATEMKDLIARARAGKLKPEEFQGGTFSISNLGMYGIRDFAAVINPPHGAILAVGAGEQRPVVRDGALGVATVMTCTLSCDHRVVDGAIGARFLAAFKKLVEAPLTMLL